MPIKRGDLYKRKSGHCKGRQGSGRRQSTQSSNFQVWRAKAIRRPRVVVTDSAVPKQDKQSFTAKRVKVTRLHVSDDTTRTQTFMDSVKLEECGYVSVAMAMLNYISESMKIYPDLDTYRHGDQDFFRFLCAELRHVLENLELVCPFSTFICDDESWYKEMVAIIYCVECEDIESADACVYQVLTDSVLRLQRYLVYYIQCIRFPHD